MTFCCSTTSSDDDDAVNNDVFKTLPRLGPAVQDVYTELRERLLLSMPNIFWRAVCIICSRRGLSFDV